MTLSTKLKQVHLKRPVKSADDRLGQTRFDLTRIPGIKAVLVNRWPQFLIRLVTLIGFLLAMIAGIVGTPVGNRNFSIVFVWIGWWALLILVAIPLLGRGWCSICPIPLPSEWLQNRSLLGPRGSRAPFGLGWKWPRALRNIWVQNGAFILMAVFSTAVLTQPLATGLMLSGLLLAAVSTNLIFERRAFCRYLCPVGGFIGLYSQVAPVEVRVRDAAVCATHKTKTCYTGSQDGYGCPWGVFPGGLVKNTSCGVCLECLRTCPLDNIAINIRPAGTDLSESRNRKLDEAYKAFIMLGSAFVYSAVLLGPWGQLKMAAFTIGSQRWILYAILFLALILVILPGLFYMATLIGRALTPSKRSLRRTFIAYGYAQVPLGLAAWISFSLSFVFTNASYLLPVLSDPFGWGWDLVGTAGYSWTPYLTSLLPALQILVLVVGLAWASLAAWRIAREEDSPAGWRQALPVNLLSLFVTVGFLWLYVG